MAGPSSPLSPNSRAQYLDLLKTVLVVGMVAAHVVQLLAFRPRPEALVFSEYVNLVTFPGFMFAFGIGLGLRKPDGRQRGRWSRLKPTVFLLLAVYASSFGFPLLYEHKPLSLDLAIDVLTMRRLFGWSEFLATFFMLSVVILVARPALLAIGRNPWFLAAATALCLATTIYTTGAIFPLLPTLVSHTGFANFPLLAYLPWFLLGIWYGGHPLRLWHFVPALAITGWLYLVTLQTGQFPQRFPPTLLWIAGPAALLLAYLGLARLVAARLRIPAVLLAPGRHVLSFLVLSNLGLFATRYFIGKPIRATWVAAVVAIGIIVALTLVWWALETVRARAAGRRQSSPVPA